MTDHTIRNGAVVPEGVGPDSLEEEVLLGILVEGVLLESPVGAVRLEILVLVLDRSPLQEEVRLLDLAEVLGSWAEVHHDLGLDRIPEVVVRRGLDHLEEDLPCLGEVDHRDPFAFEGVAAHPDLGLDLHDHGQRRGQ